MTLRFDVYPDGAGVFEFEQASAPRVWEVLEDLQAELQAGGKPAQHMRALKALVDQHPSSLEAHLALADFHFDQGQSKLALAAALAGLAVANRLIPESFAGKIEWGHLDNRPYLRLMAVAIFCLDTLRRHREAVALIERALVLNPDDNMGLRYSLGTQALRAKDRATAKAAYAAAAAEGYPPACYQLAMLHVQDQAWVQAATAFRRGISANVYIAEIINGCIRPAELPIWHGSNFAEAAFAESYISEHFDLWQANPQAKLFLRWLFNHPKVLAERAAHMACLEGLRWEGSLDKRRKLGDELETLRAAIDDASSAELVVKRVDRDGRSVYPWQLLVVRQAGWL